MKKIYMTIASLWALSAMNAQVLTNGFTKGQLLNTNYFLDASSFQGQADPSNGKLLGFPKTDLTKFKFNLGVVTDEVTLSGFDGVIVYNTVSGKVGQNADGGYTADSMGKQVAVEPGFYYFSNPNGADNQSVTEGKWIRLSDAEVSTQLWVQRQNGSITETYLKAVEGSKDFFGYQNNGDQKGERIIKVLGEPMITDNESSVYAENYLKSSINFEFFTSNAFPLSHPLSDDSFYNFNYRRNQILPDHINNSTSSLLRYNGGYNTLKIETDLSKDIDYFNGQTFQTFIGGLKDSNGEYSNININANKVVGLQAWSNIYTTGKIDQSYGLIVNSTNRGAGEVTNLRGQYIYTDVNNSKSNNVVGLYNNTAIKNNASIELGRGIASYFSVDENSAVAVNTKGIDNRYIGNSGTTNPEHIGIFNSFRLEDGATVEDFYGYRLHLPVSSNATVNRAYGIHLDDIDFADTDNYAIYTRKGAIRFGGLANASTTTNRIVTVNNDGVLSTQESANLGLWGQRDISGVTETYLKPALNNNDFVGYRSDRKFRLYLGDKPDWFLETETPYRSFITSSALPKVVDIPYTYASYKFSDSYNLITEDHAANSSKGRAGRAYIGTGVSIGTETTSPIELLIGSQNITTHGSNSTVERMIGSSGRVSIGKDGNASVVSKSATGVEAIISVVKGATAKSTIGFKAGITNKGSVENMRGISSEIVSQSVDETRSIPTHTIKNMVGFDNKINISTNANIQDDIYGASTNTEVSESVTMVANKRIYGEINQITVKSPLTENEVFVKRNGFNLAGNGSEVREVFLNQSAIYSKASIPTEVKSNVFGYHFWNSDQNNWTADKMFGIYLDKIINGQNANYGLYINSVGNSTSNTDYSIYTNEGNIRLGDLKGLGERVVTADPEGILKTTAIADLSLWKKEINNGRIVLKENSVGDARTSESSGRNDVTISDDGKITARGFIGYNGTTIFPDYVFENYYTGTSTAKADYSFKNLDQVENFVKTNGHLPGYVSAKEIKAQGYIDIMDTQLTNVEKIEELYLHTIEQEKAIKAQKEELKAKDAKIERLELDVQELKSLVQQLLNK